MNSTEDLEQTQSSAMAMESERIIELQDLIEKNIKIGKKIKYKIINKSDCLQFSQNNRSSPAHLVSP